MDGQGEGMIDEAASNGMSVAPPPPSSDAPARSGKQETNDAQAGCEHPATHVRTGLDSHDVKDLARDPSDENAKLDVALDETFPGSDAPSNTQPGKGKDPPPSTGYDPAAEEQASAGH